MDKLKDDIEYQIKLLEDAGEQKDKELCNIETLLDEVKREMQMYMTK